MKSKILNWLNRGLAILGVRLAKKKPTHPNPIEPWDNDRTFIELYSKVRANTKVRESRAFFIYQMIKNLENVSGDIAEVGVYRGGTLKFFGLVDPKVNIYGFDTFEGMPKVNKDEDLHKEGDFIDTSYEEVKEFLKENSKTSIYKGFFPNTATPISDKKFKFVHIDVDIYQSVKDCIDFFYPRMTKGGAIVFDDYGFISCPGAKKAVDESFANKPEKPLYIPNGQCLIIKR